MPGDKNEMAKSAPDGGEEEETIYIRSSMEEEEEDEALLETCIEVSYTPTRSPRQIDANSFISSFKRRHGATFLRRWGARARWMGSPRLGQEE